MENKKNKIGVAALLLSFLVIGAPAALAQTTSAEDDPTNSSTNMIRSFVDGLFINDELDIEVYGDISTGNDVSLIVLDRGTPVEDAAVWVNGGKVGLTDSNGYIEATVPKSAVFRVKASKGSYDGYLRRKIG